MPSRSAENLSARQRQILGFVQEFAKEHGYPPSVRDIARGVGINSTSVVDHHLKALARMGFLRRAAGISRGIELLIDSEPSLAVKSNLPSPFADHTESSISAHAEPVVLPIVGRIAAGEPIEAVAGEMEHITLSADIAPPDAFVLKVKGRSMIEDLIDDGDLVVVRPQATAENGDIVVVLLNDGPTGEGQVTLKRLYREKGRIRLQPANSTMQPIFVHPSQLSIQGKVVAVIRQL